MPQAKLKDVDIPEIFRLRETGLTHEAIAAKFGVRRALITRVLLRVRYRHIGEAQKPPKPKASVTSYARGERHPQAKLTDDDVLAIHTLRKEGWLQKDIAAHFSVTKGTIWDILNGRSRRPPQST